MNLQSKFNKYNYSAGANSFIITKFQRANANCSVTFFFLNQ